MHIIFFIDEHYTVLASKSLTRDWRMCMLKACEVI